MTFTDSCKWVYSIQEKEEFWTVIWLHMDVEDIGNVPLILSLEARAVIGMSLMESMILGALGAVVPGVPDFIETDACTEGLKITEMITQGIIKVCTFIIPTTAVGFHIVIY